MNKILVNNKEKEFILDNGKYEFMESGTFSLELSDLEKDIFLVVLENVEVVLNILSKNTFLNFHVNVGENASLILNNLVIEGSKL